MARAGDELADAFPEPVSPSASEPVRDATGALGGAVADTTDAVGDVLDPSGAEEPTDRGRDGGREEQRSALGALDGAPFAGALDSERDEAGGLDGVLGRGSPEAAASESSDGSGGDDQGDGPRGRNEAVLPSAQRPDLASAAGDDDEDDPSAGADESTLDLLAVSARRSAAGPGGRAGHRLGSATDESRAGDDQGSADDDAVRDGDEDSTPGDADRLAEQLREGVTREVTQRVEAALDGVPGASEALSGGGTATAPAPAGTTSRVGRTLLRSPPTSGLRGERRLLGRVVR